MNTLQDRAQAYASLIREPGWELLQKSLIRSRITDTDSAVAYLYEAIRAQVIWEIFETPHIVIQQAEREWKRQELTPDPVALGEAEE